MKKKKLKKATVLLSVTLFTLSGCVDQTYDTSGGIDLTISVGGEEFAIPGGKTEEIKLCDILEIEEDGIVRTDENGNYFLEQKGEDTYQTNIRVENINIESPEITPTITDIRFTIPTSGTTAKITGSISTDLPENFEAEFELNSDLPEEIVELTYAYLSIQGNLSFSFEQNLVNKIYLDNLNIQFPDYLISDQLDHGQYLLEHASIDQNGNLPISINIKAIDFSRLPEGSIADGKIQIKDKITVSGTASLNPEDITGNLPQEILLPLRFDTHLNDIQVHKVIAYINPKIDLTIDPVQLSDLPDFLTDEEVTLDVKNPMLLFNINNQSPADILLSGALTSSYNADRNQNDVTVGFQNIKILSNLNPTPNYYCLWTGESRPGNQPQDTTFIQVADLPKLVYKIPDQIGVDVTPMVDPEKAVEIQVNSDYAFNTDYRIQVPFQFGPNLSIVYKDTINGWMKDIEKYNVKHAKVTACLISKIPLNLQLTATPLTKHASSDASDEGFELEGVTAQVQVDGKGDNLIPAGDLNQPTPTNITIEIFETTPGQLKKLDGIFLRATANSQNNDGKYLNKHQSIQLTEVRLKVPGGVTIDANEL